MIDGFESRLADVEVLSLDVFDTVLGRRCALPEDVFTILEEELVEKHGPVFNDFARIRRESDSRARRRAWDQRQSEEILLDDIYTLLLEENPHWPLKSVALAQCEMQLEKRLLYPIEGAKALIEAARKAGKKIIFISDMYLSQEFCESCLRENGFTDYDAFYISSTVGVLKHTGRLFQHVLDDLQVAPEKILHVGDNPRSDGKEAAKLGIQTLQVQKAIDVIDRFPANPLKPLMDRPSRGFHESLLLGMSARGCLREDLHEDPFWYRIGYQFAGPLIYGYVQFIIDRIRDRNLDKVYFLSRDGFILKQVYEILTSDLSGCPAPDYLFASRRALNFASITNLDEKTENWLAEGIHLRVGEFLQRVGLKPETHLAAIHESGFSGINHLVAGGHEYQQLRSLYHRILPSLLEAAANERKTYLAYLKEKGVLDANPFVLVDVGWMTSIQRSFEKILHLEDPNSNLPLEGYYLGTYPEARQRAGARSKHVHYLMGYGEPASAMETIRHCVALVEFFFAAPEHTFIRMTGDSQAGFTPELACAHENEEDLPALQEIHTGVLEYVREMHFASPSVDIKIKPEDVLSLLHRLLASPSREEAVRLGDIKYADGYGSYFHHASIACPGSFSKLGLNKKRWKEEFKASHWRKGYYKRLPHGQRFLFNCIHPSPRFSKPYG